VNASPTWSLLILMAACAASSMAAADEPGPDWLLRPSSSPLDDGSQSSDEMQLVLQRHRIDGAELLTLRVPIATFSTVTAYAGAGLNRAKYLADANDGQALTTDYGRHRSLGAAAELGAEWHVTQRLAMSADLRWIDLAADADFLRSGNSLLAADPVSLGVRLGWRFR
jgi:opacity protein-like surface antigen